MAAYKDSTYERGKKIPWYYGGGGGNESKVAISRDLLPWAHCPLPPQRRKSLIILKPSSFPNEAYYYSMQDHFGAYHPYSKRQHVRFINKQ